MQYNNLKLIYLKLRCQNGLFKHEECLNFSEYVYGTIQNISDKEHIYPIKKYDNPTLYTDTSHITYVETLNNINFKLHDVSSFFELKPGSTILKSKKENIYIDPYFIINNRMIVFDQCTYNINKFNNCNININYKGKRRKTEKFTLDLGNNISHNVDISDIYELEVVNNQECENFFCTNIKQPINVSNIKSKCYTFKNCFLKGHIISEVGANTVILENANFIIGNNGSIYTSTLKINNYANSNKGEFYTNYVKCFYLNIRNNPVHINILEDVEEILCEHDCDLYIDTLILKNDCNIRCIHNTYHKSRLTVTIGHIICKSENENKNIKIHLKSMYSNIAFRDKPRYGGARTILLKPGQEYDDFDNESLQVKD